MRTNNSKVLGAMRASVLLLFLPAHLAFVLLIDLNFLPDAPGASSVTRPEDRGPDKDRLRLHLLRQSDGRNTMEARQPLIFRDLDPWTLRSPIPVELGGGGSVSIKITQPAALEIWLAATPQNHRAPPA
jgi:hypothetical protein